jgi:hypothetical protein
MLTLNAADTIAADADVATQITCTIEGMELATGVETYKTLYQGQLAAAAATVYTAPASTQSFVKSIHVVNTDTVSHTFQLFINGTTASHAITPVITLPVNGMAVYGEHGWRLFGPNGELFTTGGTKQWGYVSSDQSTSTIALSDIAGLASFILAPNKKYYFKAELICQSNATTVGIHHGVNFTGTVTNLVVGEPINPVAAPTAAGSASAYGVATAVATKVIATTAGPGAANVIILVEGVIEVGATGGTFSFQHGSETATATTTKRGSAGYVEEMVGV